MQIDPVSSLRELNVQRTSLVKMMTNLTNQTKAYVRTRMGFHAGLDEKTSDGIVTRASKIVDDATRNRFDDPIAEKCLPVLLSFGHSVKPLAAKREETERQMEALVRQLPIAEFVESVRGLGLLSVAKIVGEAGDLSRYHVRGLRKFFGLAPYNGKAGGTWRKSKPSLSADEWTALGYCPRRRSLMYLVEDCAAVKQKADKSKYRRLYDEHKKLYTEKFGEKYSHARAMRRVGSQILLDLQLAWCAATGATLPTRRAA